MPRPTLELIECNGDDFAILTDRIVFWRGSVRAWPVAFLAWLRNTP